ncbi:recombinase family protein [Anatilimnocola floriformis]|uniref:recombinase family protein n=1 Tax=Anatilimnocola floriformis TaxID=2948575 RepID=UPI0020C20FD3|nr:recombinase family protein [Anatilimnocola floriformis]
MRKISASSAAESTPKIRGYEYIRWSTPDQILGDSLARQNDRRDRLCERYNIELDDSLDLRDMGVSAFRGKNATKGKLGVFIEACKKGRIPKGSWLLCENFDRFSRLSFDEALPLVNAILKEGVSIAFRETIVHPNASPMEKMLMAMEFYRAHAESARKSEMLKHSWVSRRKKATEKRIAGIGPFWLEPSEDRQRWLINAERSEVVKRVFELSLSGLSQTKIAVELNRLKTPTFQRRKGHSPAWSQPMIQTILTSRAVIGEYQPHVVDEDGGRKPEGEPLLTYYPRVISDESFYRVQAELKRRDCHNQIGRNTNRPKDTVPRVKRLKRTPASRQNCVTSLFRTLIRHRGNPMIVMDKSRKSTSGEMHRFKYLIERRFDGKETGCINYDRVEQAFLKHMREIKAADLQGETCTAHDTMIAAEAKLAQCEKKLFDLESAMLDSDGDTGILAKMMVRLESQRKAAEAEAEAARRQSNVAPAQRSLADTHEIIDLLAQADDSTRYQLRSKLRMLISELVREIICFLYGKGKDKAAILGVNFRGGGYRVIVVGDPPEHALKAAGLNKGESTRTLRLPRKPR